MGCEECEVAQKLAQLALSASTAALGIAELGARMDALETAVDRWRGTFEGGRMADVPPHPRHRVDL